MAVVMQSEEGVADIRRQLEAGDDHSLWDDARKTFARGMEQRFLRKGSDDIWEDFDRFISSMTSTSEARTHCKVLRDSADKQYSTKPLTIKGYTIFPKDFLKSALANMDAFIKLGDLATKGGAESVSIGWSCVKFVLQAVEVDSANCTRWAQAGDSISRILLNCQTFARLYSMPDSSCKSSKVADDLLSMVPNTYSSILTFAWAAYQQLKHSKARRMWDQLNPFSEARNASSSALDNILSCDDTMQKQSQIAFQQVAHEAFGELLRGQDKLEDLFASGVQEILSQMSSLDDPDRADLLRFERNTKLLDPSDQSEKVFLAYQNERQKDTCDWVFDLPAYQQWHVADKSALLWIHGNAGCGKTMLMTAVIERLQKLVHEHHGVITYSFCRQSSNTNTSSAASSVKRDLLYSLYNQFKDGPNLAQANSILASNVTKQSQAGRSYSGFTNKAGPRSDTNVLSGLKESFLLLAKLLDGPVYLVIDAPDECSDFDDDLKEAISAWSQTTDCKLKVIIATRPRPELEGPTGDTQSINIEKHNKQDIALRATADVFKVPGLSEHERRLLIDTVVEKADTQFTYIALAMDLLRQPWKRPIETVLHRMSDGVNGMYQQILRNTNPSFAELARVALRWTLLRQDDLPIDTFFDIYSDRFVGDDSTLEGADSRVEANGAESQAGVDKSFAGLDPDNKIFRDQISEAVGQFIDVVGSNGHLTETHKSVTDCFLRHGTAPTTRQHNIQSVCLGCAQKLTANDSFHVYAEDHLQIAARIIQHLNSSTFRNLYFRKLPDMNANPAEMETDGLPPSQDGNGSADDSVDASEDDPNDKSDLQNAQDADVVQYLKIQAARKATELDYDDDDSDDNMDTKEFKEIAAGADDDVPSGVARYEMINWIAHIDEAQKALGTNESRCPESWQALWVQLEIFLTDDKKYKSWLHTITAEDDSEPDPDSWSEGPLHVMATFGLTWAVRRLLADGLCAVTSLAANQSLPLTCLALYEGMNDDLELLDLLTTGLEVTGSRDLRAARRQAFLQLLTNDPSPQFLERLAEIFSHFESNLGFTDSQGLNALHYIANHSTHVGLVPILQKYGVDINAKGHGAMTPLHVMFTYRMPKVELVDEFLRHGANVNDETSSSFQPLALALKLGDLSAINTLLQYGADVEDFSVTGFNPMHTASLLQRVDIIGALLENGATLDVVSLVEGYTPLYVACSVSDDTAAQYLLEKYVEGPRSWDTAEIDRENFIGKTPLRKACVTGQVATVKSLLKLPGIESRVNIVDRQRGRTPLHGAARNGHHAVVELLVREGARPAILDKAGKTPLDLCGEGWHTGLQLGYVATALALIGADTKSAAKNRIIMMAAATHGGKDVVEKLLSIGAEHNFKDRHEWSPMLAARYHGHLEIVGIFEQEELKGEFPSRMIGTYTSTKLTSDHASSVYRFMAADQPIALLSDHPIPAISTKYYFEVTFMDAVAEDEPSFVAVGLSTVVAKASKSWVVGKPTTGISSWGYHSDDGSLFHHDIRGGIARKLYKPYGPGDTIGCALFTDTGTILYTRNGESLGVVVNDAKGRLFPCVCLANNVVVSVNLGKEPFRWQAANSADYTRYSK